MKNFVQFFALAFMFTALLIGCKRDNGPDAGEANQAAQGGESVAYAYLIGLSQPEESFKTPSLC